MARLFSKEKDIFLKIINFVLIIWLIVVVVITFGVGIKIVNKDVVPSYSNYSKQVCDLDKIPSEEVDRQLIKDRCYESYISEKSNVENLNKKNIKNVLISISNIIIVSLFIHLLNKKTK